MFKKGYKTLPMLEHTSRNPRIHVVSAGHISETMHCRILRHAGTHLKLMTFKTYSTKVHFAAGIMGSGVERHHNTLSGKTLGKIRITVGY